MYFGSFFNARNTDTYSYFKRGIFGANSGWTFTNLQTNAPRVSNKTTLFQQKIDFKHNQIFQNYFEFAYGSHLILRLDKGILKLFT